jgi:hypothetical protein
MAGSNGPGQRIDQIRFGYGEPNDLDFKGYGPMGHSVPDRAELHAWTERLHLHYRSEDSALSPRPPVSQVYWSDGENAAVLRRVRTAAADNRDDACHALVGPAAMLTARHALCMDEAWWSRLRESDPKARSPITLPVWSNDLAAAKGLANRSRELVGPLTALAAAALPDPRRPISIVTADTSIEDRMALLWALLEMAGTADGVPPWTFSTYETRHDDEVERVHVMFLTAVPPQQSHGHSRVTVDLSDTPPDGSLDAARQWVAEYIQAGGDGARAWLDRYQPSAADTFASSESGSASVWPETYPGAQPGTGLPHHDAVREAQSAEPARWAPRQQEPPREPAPGEARESPGERPAEPELTHQIAPREPGQNQVQAPMSQSVPHTVSGPGHAADNSAVQPSRMLGLVNRLGKARVPGDVLLTLDDIRRTPIPESIEDRRKIRDRLFTARFWIRELEAIFDVENQPRNIDHVRPVLRELIAVALPLADLTEPVRVDSANRFVADLSSPARVVDELLQHAAMSGAPNALDAGCAARLKRLMGLPAPLPHRAEQARKASLQRNRWRFAALVLAACLAAILMVLLIQLAGNRRKPAAPYQGYHLILGPTHLNVPAPTCNDPVYVDVDKPRVQAPVEDADISYSADCADRRISPNLTLIGINTADILVPTDQAYPHQCLSNGSRPDIVTLHEGQHLCITIKNRLVELNVLTESSEPLQIELAEWER